MTIVKCVFLVALILTTLTYLFVRKKIKNVLAIRIYFVLILFITNAILLGIGAISWSITSYLINVYLR